MNQHDAQKMANLLHHAGLEPSERAEAADVVVIHTCSIREKAEHRLYTELGILLARKRVEPGLVVGVGGCVAQQEGESLLRRFPKLDFVFGPQNLVHLPAMVSAARERERSLRVDYDDAAGARFDLPQRHPALRVAHAGPRLRDGDGGLRPVLRLLRRAAHPRPRGESAERPDPGRGPRARRVRHAARSRCSGRPSTPTAGRGRAGSRARSRSPT